MKYLTARVAAQRLGVSYPTLKQWIYRKAIQAMRTPGGHYRVPESEIERLRAQPSVAGPVRISGRNQLRGRVQAIRRDGLLAAVTLQIGDQQIQAVITSEAVDDLGLEVGAPATALIKATEVMLMK